MKRIGVLSDTHGWIHPDLFEFFENVDEIWHAGDIGGIDIYDQLAAFKPIKAVYGNTDDSKVRLVCPKTQSFTVENVKILMTHIGGHPGKYEYGVRDLFVAEKPKIFVCGHSHIAKVMYDKKYDFLYINPGAAGYRGFHKYMTAIRFVIDGDNIKDLELIELGEREKVFEDKMR